MISYFSRSDRQLTVLLLHVALGAAATWLPASIIIWIYLLLATLVMEYVNYQNTRGAIHYFLAYYIGMEIMARIVQASPVVPYESGKYFMFSALLLGLMSTSARSRTTAGWLILLLVLPSFAVLPASITYKDLVFNVMGVINLALAVVYFSRIRLRPDEITALLRIFVLGLVPVLISVILKTPDFDDLKFSLGANFSTSAGFGSNQVSTVLSLAFLILGFSLMFRIPVFRWPQLSILLFVAFFFRALLTFSRGGLVSALIVLVVVWLCAYLFFRDLLPRALTTWRAFVGVLLVVVVFYQANRLTSNLLLLRYQGETTATLAGKREKDLSVLTSNRFDIVMADLRVWQTSPVMGVGPGMSKYARAEMFNDQAAAHVEGSRLVAEHGLFGVAILITLFVFPAYWVLREKNPYLRALQICFFSYALLSTVHSAMRTNVTPVLYGAAVAGLANAGRARPREAKVSTIDPIKQA
ncbi:MAG: O-antigen ligase family protein [Cyclobacteriaceae bacterium]|nr:O-antigen ligase family protein [Cyclobacteriaceae bacterium]